MSESSEIEATAPADSFWEVGQFKVRMQIVLLGTLKPGNGDFSRIETNLEQH